MDVPTVTFESTTTLTQAEFAEWAAAHEGDLHEYELLNGRIVMTPPAGYPHGSIELRIGQIVLSFVEARSAGHVFGSSQGFELPSGDTVAPDCSVVSNARWQSAPRPEHGKFLHVVPSLVVEILSTSTASRDRGEKKAIYERNGVEEYWLVDARARTVTVFVLRGDRLDGGRVFGSDERFASQVLVGLEVEVGRLFE